MFDKYTIEGGGSSHNTTTIIEKRAPTDDSVKLLREMEDAAEKKLLGAIRLDTNTGHHNTRWIAGLNREVEGMDGDDL